MDLNNLSNKLNQIIETIRIIKVQIDDLEKEAISISNEIDSNYPKNIKINTLRLPLLIRNNVTKGKSVRCKSEINNMPFDYGLFLCFESDVSLLCCDKNGVISYNIPFYKAKNVAHNGEFKYKTTEFIKQKPFYKKGYDKY